MQNGYNQILDTFPLAAFVFDEELAILHVNNTCLQMLNVSLSEIKKQSIKDYFPQINSCILQEGENIETLFICNNKKKNNISVKYSSFKNDTSFGILYVVKDSFINDQIVSKHKFNESVLDNIPADIAVFDKNHNYLYINSTGVKDDDLRKWLIGKSDFDYYEFKGIDTSKAKYRRDLFMKAIETKSQMEWVDDYHKEGKDIHVMRRFYPIFIEGKFVYMIGYGIDISELKNTQATVLINEIRNQLILQSALDAIIMVNSEGNITFWNSQAEKVFGWKSESVIGKNASDLIIPQRLRFLYNKGIEKSIPNKILELTAINKKEEEFPIEFSIIRINDDKGQTSYCAFIRNITSRKNKEKEISLQNKTLQSQNQELEQFTYITSHDLQEPLLTLMSFSELLLEDHLESLNEEGKLYVDFINKSAIRMRALVTGLMEYARIGKREELTLINCNSVLEEVLNDLSVKINNSQAKIQVEKLPNFTGYETYIRLLFQNLISNSIKFTKENTLPEIHIKCEETEKDWLFSISDNGIGIDKKYIDQIFIIFKRLNHQDKYSGYGIGLAHCKKIIDLHNGEISIQSVLGEGSTFNFTISKNI
jgi:PAS domain S-box-containing protein